MAGFSYEFMGVLLTIELILLGVAIVTETYRALSGKHWAVPIPLREEDSNVRFLDEKRGGREAERHAA